MDTLELFKWATQLIVFPLLFMVYRLTIASIERQNKTIVEMVSNNKKSSDNRISGLGTELHDLHDRFHQYQLKVANEYIKREDIKPVMDELKALDSKLERMVNNMSEMNQHFTEKLHERRHESRHENR
jgi:chromosome condensin MukBEF ATPase and DNA-binding subunit MukB